MDFSKYNLTNEQKAEVEADFDKEVQGLKDKNSQVLGASANLKTRLSESEQQAKDAKSALLAAQQSLAERLQSAQEPQELT